MNVGKKLSWRQKKVASTMMATTNRQFRYYMNIWIVIQAFFTMCFTAFLYLTWPSHLRPVAENAIRRDTLSVCKQWVRLRDTEGNRRQPCDEFLWIVPGNFFQCTPSKYTLNCSRNLVCPEKIDETHSQRLTLVNLKFSPESFLITFIVCVRDADDARKKSTFIILF